VAALGAQMLPLLANNDLYAETPEELDSLDRDWVLILDNLSNVATSTGHEPRYIAFRIGNVRNAVERAATRRQCRGLVTTSTQAWSTTDQFVEAT